jgi:hypothetical protein
MWDYIQWVDAIAPVREVTFWRLSVVGFYDVFGLETDRLGNYGVFPYACTVTVSSHVTCFTGRVCVGGGVGLVCGEACPVKQ